jgi:hypothetical protein
MRWPSPGRCSPLQLIGRAVLGLMGRERQRRERAIRAGVDAAPSEARGARPARDAGGLTRSPGSRRSRPPAAPNRSWAEDAGPELGERVKGFPRTGPRRDAAEGPREGSPDGRAARRHPERTGASTTTSRRPTPRRRRLPSSAGVDLDRTEPGGGRPGRLASPAVADLATPSTIGPSCAPGGLADRAGGARRWSRLPTADPDPWRNRLRDTLGRMGATRPASWSPKRLAATANVDHLPGASVTRLAAALRSSADATRRSPCGGPRRRTVTTSGSTRPRAAPGLRPSRAGAPLFAVAAGISSRSGLALSGLGRPSSKVASRRRPDVLREVIQLRPEDASATSRWGRPSACSGSRMRRMQSSARPDV